MHMQAVERGLQHARLTSTNAQLVNELDYELQWGTIALMLAAPEKVCEESHLIRPKKVLALLVHVRLSTKGFALLSLHAPAASIVRWSHFVLSCRSQTGHRLLMAYMCVCVCP